MSFPTKSVLISFFCLSLVFSLFSTNVFANEPLKSNAVKQMKVEQENKKQATQVSEKEEAAAVNEDTVILKTNRGDIVIELATHKAPVTVENFKRYVNNSFYDGTIFHRVIPGFMIQGGGFEKGLLKKPTLASIKNEADNGLPNIVGSIAMARTGVPDSATAQFFINVNDNNNLNHTSKTPRGWGYAVFGQVIEGLEIVMTISKEKTGRKEQYSDVPVQDIIIEKAFFQQAE